MASKRVGFVATRLAGADGVTLETARWRTVLERLGATCQAFAGTVEGYAEHEMVMPLAHFALDLLVAENALAIPMHVPLGLTLTQVIAETGIPVIAHHQDFAWERDRFRINACGDYLHGAFPPDLPTIHHVVINSCASEQLSHRKGLSNTVVPNL